MYKLPVDYTELTFLERKLVREQYIKEQKNLCYYCKSPLNEKPPKDITDKKINWNLFPNNFLAYDIHLQHNHYNGMTEWAVHSYCNAVMWEYEWR